MDNARFVGVMEDPEIAAAGQDLVKTILHEYESILDIEEGTKEIARIIKSFIISNFNGKAPENMNVLFDKLYKTKDAVKIYGEDTVHNRQAWYDKMMSIAETIKSKVSEKGTVITDLRVVSTPEKFEEGRLVPSNVPRVSSKIDIIAVDSSGMTHIFDIKTSKKSFSRWDSAKVLTSDWALAIKRQLLGQKIDINNVALYVIPITVDALGNASHLKVGELEPRTNDETTGLRDNGYINVIADKLLPRKIFSVYDPGRTNKLKNRLKQVIDDVYEVRTEAEDTNVDKILEIAERSFSRNGGMFRYYNAYEGIDGINGGRKGNIEVIPKSLEKADVKAAKAEFRVLIEKYVEFVKLKDNRGVSILYDAITHALSSDEKIKTGKHQQRLRYILNEYLNKDWETVDIKEGIPMGIIVLRNKNTGVINIFSLSVDQFKAPVKEDGLTDKSLENMTYKDLDVLKSMVFLDEFRNELLPNQAYKLGQLITFNPKTGDNFYVPMTEALDLYKDRMFKLGLDKEVNIREEDLLAIEDVALNDLQSVLDNYEGEHRDKLDGIAKMLEEGHVGTMSKERLTKTLEALLKEFPDYINKTIDAKMNFEDPIEVILALLQTAILTKSDIDLHGDFRDLTKYSFQYADFKSLVTSLYKKNQEQYDKLGNKIQGLFQGLV